MLLPLLMNLGMLGGSPPLVGGGLRKRRRRKLAPIALSVSLVGPLPELTAALRVRAGRVAVRADLIGAPGEMRGALTVRPIPVRAAAAVQGHAPTLAGSMAVLDEVMQSTRRQEDFLLLFDEDPTEAREWLELDEELVDV